MNIRFRAMLAAVFLALCLTAVRATPPDSPNATRATDIATGTQLITPQKLKMHLSFIASDELEGRNTPSKGLDLAARYIASHLEYYGYQPAGDNGGFYQTITMSRRKTSKESKLTVLAGDQKVEFGMGVDFVGSGGAVKAELVFAGYGLVSKQADYDDYAGLDVKGKVVVVMDGEPQGFDENAFRIERKFGNRTFQTAMNKGALARERGAIGTITLKGEEFTTRKDDKPSPIEAAMTRMSAERLVLDFQEQAGLLGIDLTAAAGAKLEDLLGLDLAGLKAKIAETKMPQPAKVSASVEVEMKTDIVEKFSTQNVVAFLEGSDPKLKEEIVLFSAHYDHVGMMQPGASRGPAQAPGGPPADRIFNGADDDGSGTVGILNLAESFVAINRPRRSLMFVWHCGEEKGLWGSDYYVKRPTKPLDKIVANINIDMIGRNSDDKPENSNHMFVIGVRRTSQELTDLVYKVNADRMRLDETDNANYFMRSDHFNYARNRIPVAFFFTGVHKDYHKVTDEVQLIQFDKMKKILDIIFEVGLEVANRDARPAYSGQEF